jgi:hypothetical protein
MPVYEQGSRGPHGSPPEIATAPGAAPPADPTGYLATLLQHPGIRTGGRPLASVEEKLASGELVPPPDWTPALGSGRDLFLRRVGRGGGR